MKIRARILIWTLGASLTFTVVLGVVFFLSVADIRRTVLANSYGLGDSAADISAGALEDQLTKRIDRIARDTALVLDERINKVENHTRMTADIAGSIYTNRRNWSPKPLPRVLPGEVSPGGPFLYIAPGVDFAGVRDEARLAGNIGDMLRQITVVDGGITTSTIASESGFVVAVDSYPWSLADYDPRSHAWYGGAKLTGGLFWTNVYDDHRGRGPIISCSVPFYEQSGGGVVFRGVARSTVMLSDFSRIIDSAQAGGTGYLFLLNRDGIKIYSSGRVEVTLNADGTVEGENFLTSPDRRLRSLGLSMTLGASGMTELEMDGVPVYVAYAPVQTLGWSLAVAVPVQEIYASTFLIENQIWRITDNTRAVMDRRILLAAGLIALLFLLTLAGITVFAFRFTGAITGPILALNDGVREVSGGNLDREVIVKTGDELEQLSTSFNTMTARLRSYIEEIARATAEKQRIDTELDIATAIQMSMLPNDFPPFSDRKNQFDLYAQMYPAKEVGGDFYDFFFIDDDRFAVIIADVSGKGIPAALFMAITKAVIKDHLLNGEEPRLALDNINRQLCIGNSSYMFVTLWLGVLNIPSGRLEFINAGHNPPLIKRGNGNFTFLVSPPDLVLAGMDDTLYTRRETVFGESDTLFLYTDGVTEAADTEGAFYGKDRLKAFLDANAALPLKELLPRLRTDITAFAGGEEQWDDITMLALRTGKPQTFGLTHTVTLKADISELEILNAFIGRELDASNCPGRVRGHIELAVEEIFINITRYAYRDRTENGGAGEVTVECLTVPVPGGTAINLRFTDYGVPFDPTETADPDIDLPLDEREEGKLGLLIVKKTMDTMHYSRESGVPGGANRLELSKSWQKEEQ